MTDQASLVPPARTELTPVPKAIQDLQPGIVATEYGFLIRSAPTYTVEVHRALFNWRLVLHVHGFECSPPSDEHPNGMCPTLEHGYCFFGLGLESLTRAVAAGLKWDDPLHTEPTGFDRKAF